MLVNTVAELHVMLFTLKCNNINQDVYNSSSKGKKNSYYPVCSKQSQTIRNICSRKSTDLKVTTQFYELFEACASNMTGKLLKINQISPSPSD